MLLLALLLSACEPASTYDPQRGRYVSTDEYRRDQITREIDREYLRQHQDR